ncbi:MAG: hypothetical protein J2P48_19290 [Alphaproteobacteria bacterium]|nr:hypothetical protein [Alphaproteobacteria bacterium]
MQVGIAGLDLGPSTIAAACGTDAIVEPFRPTMAEPAKGSLLSSAQRVVRFARPIPRRSTRRAGMPLRSPGAA